MHKVVRALIAITITAVAACGGGSRPPTEPPTQPPATPPTNSPTPITGRERIGWTQPASSVADYVFSIYVDNTRVELTGTSCTAASGAFDCDAPLPPLTNGTHTLQLAAAIRSGESLVEGAKSAAITVTVSGTASASATGARAEDASAPSLIASPSSVASAGPQASIAASCGLAPWDGSAALVWSSRGEIAIVDAAVRTMRSLTWENDAAAHAWQLESVVRRGDAGRSLLYTVFLSREDDTPTLHVVRYRDVDGVLGERAVLLERALPSTATRASASFGPDGLLYVSFAWATPRAAAEPFVVIVDADGRRPGTNGALDPRFQSRAAVAASWGADGKFWIVESEGGGHYAVRGADADGPAWRFDAAQPPIGLQALPDPDRPRLAVFAAGGPGWLLSADGTVATTDFDDASAATRQATLLVSGTAVSCRTSPRLTISYAEWRGEPSGSSIQTASLPALFAAINARSADSSSAVGVVRRPSIPTPTLIVIFTPA